MAKEVAALEKVISILKAFQATKPALWGGRHGSTEDGLDDEGVVGLEGVTVGTTEGVRDPYTQICMNN
jgi:hypothetical protein